MRLLGVDRLPLPSLWQRLKSNPVLSIPDVIVPVWRTLLNRDNGTFLQGLDSFSDAVVDDDERSKQIGPPPAKEGIECQS
jgi:hypothetical protein